MLYLIAKHLLSDSYGPLDRGLEVGVLLLIAWEVIVNIVKHRGATRRQRELKTIVTSLCQLMDEGLGLQMSVPNAVTEEPGVLEAWMINANVWGGKAGEFLAAHSQQASAAFLLVHDSSKADFMVLTLAGDGIFFLATPLKENYQRLLTQLNTMRQIIAKPEAYF
jgi:hypothetical protein